MVQCYETIFCLVFVTFSVWVQTGATFERRGGRVSSFWPKQMLLNKLKFLVSRGWRKGDNETPIYNKSIDGDQISSFWFFFCGVFSRVSFHQEFKSVDIATWM